jgi:NAD-dependent deacetylase
MLRIPFSESKVQDQKCKVKRARSKGQDPKSGIKSRGMMIIDKAPEAASHLAALIREADEVLGFTGAGISTECGVPDFRSPGSPWMVNKPIPFPIFVANAEARQEAWRRKFAMDDTYAGAKPGKGHAALVALHRLGKMPYLVTQNIDGLHQASGLPTQNVIELHGNGTYAHCLECGLRHELSDIRPYFESHGHAPECKECNGIIKSATISFGQAMPEDKMRKAVKLTLSCQLFLAIGSSLVVFPAAGLPRAAKENGAALVIINHEATALDSMADLVIRADIGTVLDLTRHQLSL